MDGQQYSASRGSNDLTSRDDTMKISSSFLASLSRNTNASSSFGPIRSISSLKAHRGPYSRPSALDKDSRYSPYVKKPMQVRATKIANESPNINLTSTAERIIQTLANCSTPVVDIKKSPIDSLKSLKPEFPTFRRDTKSGPPVTRSSFDTTPTPYKSIMLPADLPELVKAQPKNTAEVDTRTLISDIFPTEENVSDDEDQQAGGGSGDFAEGGNSSDPTTTELFDRSGRINLTNVKFEAWSLDKYTTNDKNDEESSDSSSEDEDGNPYIKAPSKVSGQSEKSALVESKILTVPPASVTSTNRKWECPTCMVQAGMHESVCPCCQTANPHAKSKPAQLTSTQKWECPTCMVSAGMDESVCPCCQTSNPHLKTNPALASGSSSQPANSSPFTFGFQAGATATTKTTTADTSFRFGEEPKSNSLVTNFKLGFNSTSTDTANTTATTKSTFSFGVNTPNAPPPITFGFGNRAPEKAVDKSEGSGSVQFDVLDFAKKSAKEEVWECPSCMVMNKKSQPKCECCQELQSEAKPQSSTKIDNIVPPTTTQASHPAFGFSSMPPPSTIPKQSSVFPPKNRPKLVYGLKPEDETSVESQVVEPAKPNPFSSFTFGSSQKTSTQADVPKPTPLTNEMWSCNLCTALNNGSNERCSGCGGSKPRPIPQQPLKPQTGSQYEKYTFQPFYGIDPDNANKSKSEPSSMFKPGTLVPQPTVTIGSSKEFSFGTPTIPIPTPVTAPVGASAEFKFGSVSGEAVKRKADEGSGTGSGSSVGFNFPGSSEPKLKLRASGAETPTPAPSFGLKSGSVLDALKQPGFGSVDKPDGTTVPPVSTGTNQFQTSSSFTFPTSSPTPTTAASIQPSAPAAGVFQFGSTTSNPPPVSSGFSFSGLSNQTSAPPPVFGLQPTQGGFAFGQPAMPASVQQNTYVPPAFSLTPNTNFGAAQPWDASTSNPYNFQSPPSQGGSAAAPRRIRKAIRRTK